MTRVLSEGLKLEDWLQSTEQRRLELEAFSRSKLPPGISSSEEMDATIQAADDASRLLADIQGYLVMHTAQAIYAVKQEDEGLSADERKSIIKDRVRDIKRLVDGLATTHATLKNRLFAILNANRSR